MCVSVVTVRVAAENDLPSNEVRNSGEGNLLPAIHTSLEPKLPDLVPKSKKAAGGEHVETQEQKEARGEGQFTLWDGLKDLGWLPLLLMGVGGLSIIDVIEKAVFRDLRLTTPLQFVVDGYHRLASLVGGIFEPALMPFVQWIDTYFRWNLHLQPHWRSLFLLGWVFAVGEARAEWRSDSEVLEGRWSSWSTSGRLSRAALTLFFMGLAALLGAFASGLLPATGPWWLQGIAGAAPFAFLVFAFSASGAWIRSGQIRWSELKDELALGLLFGCIAFAIGAVASSVPNTLLAQAIVVSPGLFNARWAFQRLSVAIGNGDGPNPRSDASSLFVDMRTPRERRRESKATERRRFVTSVLIAIGSIAFTSALAWLLQPAVAEIVHRALPSAQLASLWVWQFGLCAPFVLFHLRVLDSRPPIIEEAVVRLLIMGGAALGAALTSGVLFLLESWWALGLAAALPVVSLRVAAGLARAVTGLLGRVTQELWKVVPVVVVFAGAIFAIGAIIDLLVPAGAGVLALGLGVGAFGLLRLSAGLRPTHLRSVRAGLNILGGFFTAGLILIADAVLRYFI